MRQVISGLVAAAAVMVVGAAPATACGFGGCSPCGGYVSPCAAPIVQSYNYGGCNTGCGGGYGARADVSSQYYYVNQGPTYTGPGQFAPYPTYQEDAVVNYGASPYGYGYGAAAVVGGYHRPYYRPYGYGYGARVGYLPRPHYGYGGRYGYGARMGYGGRFGYGGRGLRRYY